MKKITLLFTSLFFMAVSTAQIDVSVDVNDTWIGFINVFNLDNTSANNGFSYPVADLRTDVNTGDNTVSVFPNFLIWDLNDDTPGTGPFDAEWNPYWFSAPGVPDKKVELNSFLERNRTSNPEFFNQDVTFVFSVTEFNLTAPEASDFDVKAFIKVFAADFSSVRQYDVTLTGAGDFTITAPAGDFVAADQIFQWGFQVYGPIVDDALEPLRAIGGIKTINTALLSSNSFDNNSFKVFPNPSNTVWNISGLDTTIEKVEVFDILGKSVLSLEPNSQDVSIDASALKTGLYLAKLSSKGASTTLRLVKN